MALVRTAQACALAPAVHCLPQRVIMDSSRRITAASESAPAPGVSHARLGAVAIAVGLAWIVAIGYSSYPALPYSPVRLPYAKQLHTFLWAPQGWSFFTRNPREEKRTAYVLRGSTWESVLLAPHGRLSNLGGLRRKSRAQLLEIGRLVNGLPEDAWLPCEESVEECLAKLPPGRAVKNTFPEPTMCGTTAIVLQRLVPWAWAQSPTPVTMPLRVVPLEVSC